MESAFGVTHLVASWHARTPAGEWVEIQARGSDGPAAWSPWLSLGRWSLHDDPPRESADGQRGPTYQVDVDEVVVDADAAWTRWQVRANASSDRVRLESLTVSTAGLPADWTVTTPSLPSTGDPVRIDLPAYSQQRHRGLLPRLNGGGSSWCSPASVAMVLDHWGVAPSGDELSWVGPDHPDPVVAETVARSYDHRWQGAGNWSFNVVYAATRGVDAFVTRLRDLRDVDAFLRAGIPPVLSVTFQRGELDGADYDTDGHLFVASGLTAEGDIVVHDPASHGIADNAEVVTTYSRGQLERAWLSGSGGLVYVVRPTTVPLPAASPDDAW